MTIQEKVEVLMSQLNYEWYLRKKADFLKHPFYKMELDKIYDDFEVHDSDGRVMPILADVNLEYFCFQSNVYTSLSIFDVDGPQTAIDAARIAEEIMSVLQNALGKVSDNQQIDYFLKKVGTYIDNYIEDSLKTYQEDRYNGALNLFRDKLNGKIDDVYGHVRMQLEVDNEWANLKSTKPNKVVQTSISAFKAINKKELPDALTCLKTKKLIDADTTLPEFKGIFGGETILRKVRWIGKKNQLHYFIQELLKQKKIRPCEDIWITTAYCFAEPDGSVIAHHKLRKNIGLKDTREIDSILLNF